MVTRLTSSYAGLPCTSPGDLHRQIPFLSCLDSLLLCRARNCSLARRELERALKKLC